MTTAGCLSETGATPPLKAFEGSWTIARKISDRLTGEELRFEGLARFAPGVDGMRYTETGDLILPRGGTLKGTRQYVFREGENGIDVCFDDGRPFHRIPRLGATDAAHWCDPDSYHVSYDFRSWPDWTAEWRVHGPRKNYRMLTFYRRV